MIRCLVSDLDGTLLQKDETITSKDIAAISKWIETGHRFWVATGRPVGMLERLQKLGVYPEYMVGSTGAVITDGKNTDVIGKIDEDVARRLVAFLDMYPETDYVIDAIAASGFYAKTTHGYFYSHMGRRPKAVYDPSTFFDSGDTMIKAFVICRDDEVSEALKSALADAFADELVAYNADKRCLEVVSPYTGKWSSILRMANNLGLSADEIACIGDEGNDIEMISSSGLGFAMASARDEVHSSADYIVKDVAEAIEILLASSDI